MDYETKFSNTMNALYGFYLMEQDYRNCVGESTFKHSENYFWNTQYMSALVQKYEPWNEDLLDDYYDIIFEDDDYYDDEDDYYCYDDDYDIDEEESA